MKANRGWKNISIAPVASLGKPLLRRQCRVLVNRRKMMRDVAVGVMLQFVAKHPWRSVRFDRLVDPSFIPSRSPPIVETKLVVWIPIGRSDPSSQIPGHPRNSVAAFRRSVLEQLLDLGCEFWRDALVG